MVILNRKLVGRLGCLLLAGVAVAVAGCRGNDDAAVLYTQVRSANKLVLGQMTISKMATVDDIDLADAKGLKQTAAGLVDAVKVGSRKAAYSYDTYLRAYVDLDALRPEDITLDKSTMTAEITLPAVQTEFAGRDMQMREDHYRVTGLRSEIDARERARIKEQMNAALRREVEEKSRFKDLLTETAKAKGRKFFESMFAANGYKVTVNYR